MKRYQMGYPNNGMDEHPEGRWVLYSEVTHLQRLLQSLLEEGMGVEGASIIEIADLRRQLADAIRERDQYKAACELADALRPLGAVQVVEGGGAVLLDTSRK